MSKKPFVKRPMIGIEHLGGRNVGRPSIEYVRKGKEAHRYRGGRPRS